MELNKAVHVESPRINIGRRYWIQRLMTKLIEKLSCKNPKTVLIQRMMSPYGRTLLRGFISDSLARLNDSEHCCMMSFPVLLQVYVGCYCLKDIFQIVVCPLSARIVSNQFECDYLLMERMRDVLGVSFQMGSIIEMMLLLILTVMSRYWQTGFQRR